MKNKYLILFLLITTGFTHHRLLAQNDIIYVKGSTQKIEQLVGDYDNQLGKLTRNRTKANFNVPNTDLGVPFEHDNKTYVAFGDIFLDDRDPLAYTTDTVPEDGIDLSFVTQSPGNFQPIVIPGLDLGGFGVPTEGVSWNGNMYLYATQTGMSFSALAKSTDNGKSFTKLYDMSNDKFINISLIKGKTDENYPEPHNTDIQIMMGSGVYRQSNVYLSYQRADKIELNSRMYYIGLEDSVPQWSSTESQAAPLFHQPCVGELSFSYNKFINKYMLLYNCGQPRGINCRTSDNPWGPWSEPFLIFEPRQDNGYCHFMHANWEVERCDAVQDPGRENVWGGEYGPYQFENLATGNESETTIYYTMSTWNPYTVVLMKSKLRRKDAITTGQEGELSIQNYKVYPNPAKQQLFIESSAELGSAGFVLRDLQGRAVLEKDFIKGSARKYELSTIGIESGIYFLTITSSQSTGTITQKVVITN